MPLTENLWINSDNLIVWDGLYDEQQGEFVNDATVTFSILDSDGASLGDGYTDVEMTYVTGSDGRYQGILDEEAPLVNGRIYYVKMNAVASDDRKAEKRLKRIARYQDN